LADAGLRILITGGAGYTGIPLARSLLSLGHFVEIHDVLRNGDQGLRAVIDHPRLTFKRQDVRLVHSDDVRDFDVVFHLAGISGLPECDAFPVEARDINVRGTQALLEALRPETKLINASTTSFYGSSGRPSTEETPLTPLSLYGESKAEAEKLVSERPNSCSLRWATIFGYAPLFRLSLMPNDFVARALFDGAIPLYDGDSRRSFLHVSDQVSGYCYAMDHWLSFENSVVNMGSENFNLTKRELAEEVVALVPAEILDLRNGDADKRHFFVDYSLARKLGYEPNSRLRDGLEEVVKAMRFLKYRRDHL